MEMLGSENRALINSNVPIWLITGLSKTVCINFISPHHIDEQDKNTISCCCMGWKTKCNSHRLNILIHSLWVTVPRRISCHTFQWIIYQDTT